MSALNNAWNSMAGQAASNAYGDPWADPRTAYGNAIQGSPHQQIVSPPKPRINDIPVPLFDEIAQDPNAQRMWENMDSDAQWRMIERYHKQEEEKRMQEKIDAYDPNKENAYAVSLSTAVDLWRVKHGDAWVRAQQTYADGDLYGELQVRLQDNNCFECMSKYDRTWLRLKENI